MKTINTDGIHYIEKISGATCDWYYGLSYEHGDLYEAEEAFKEGHPIRGRKLCLIHYPDGKIFFPVPKMKGHYSEAPVFLDEAIFIEEVDFLEGIIKIFRFSCSDYTTEIYARIPLASVKDCYNLSLQISPLTLTRQSAFDNEFEIVWPERSSFKLEDHDSFFLREDDKLYFSRWYEEGEGNNYKYWEETIIKDLEGNILETIPGGVRPMPNGEIWHLE